MSIVNLSNHTLTDSERSILRRGMKFCPTPQSQNENERKSDLHEFCRKLRLKEHFGNCNYESNSVVRQRTGWSPDSGKNDVLDSVISYLKIQPPSELKGKPKYNISLNERKSLQSLSSNKNLIIKEADKGSAVVLMNATFYEQKILEILNNSKEYKRVPKDMDVNTMNKIKRLIKVHENHLTKEERDYVINFEWKSSLFYGLPKIHKSNTITKEIKISRN